MNYDIFSSKDRKIMMWDRSDLAELIDCFTKQEYYEMQDYLDHSPLAPQRLGDMVAEEEYGCLVYEYMINRFHELIEIGQKKEIRAFFESLLEWYTEDSYISQLEHEPQQLISC